MTTESSPTPAIGDGELRLPPPPGAIRRFWAAHPRTVDVLVMLVYAVPAAADLILGALANLMGAAPDTPTLVARVITDIAVATALMFRRSHPLTVTAVAFVASVVMLPLGSDADWSLVGLMMGLYATAVYRGAREAWIAFGVAGGTWALLKLLADPPTAIFDAISGLAFVLLATLIGTNVGNRRRYVAALVDRAAQLARERDQQTLLAAASERSRIARELHDIVAHSLSVMVRLSDGAQAVAETDPSAAKVAMEHVGTVGRRSLAEMRRLLGVLREDGTAVEAAPQPKLTDLAELIDGYRAAGLPVVLQLSGTPPTADGVQVAIFRTVQECLTNALRYARSPSRVLVDIRYSTAEGVVIEVTDDGASGPAQESVGTERGLIGIAERAALYGGSVDSGEKPDGGWRVRVTLPQAREDEQ
ncbi:sensor histidine kinase [Cryobacterium sp. BB736]|uniref:sensor histidine kinase n=1 Tax=Cryobacterium sp. BB736 TaxID=2746963 RepID=UPI001873B71E|nr:histidine kinase [Cryobacterium sp. BB736]